MFKSIPKASFGGLPDIPGSTRVHSLEIAFAVVLLDPLTPANSEMMPVVPSTRRTTACVSEVKPQEIELMSETVFEEHRLTSCSAVAAAAAAWQTQHDTATYSTYSLQQPQQTVKPVIAYYSVGE